MEDIKFNTGGTLQNWSYSHISMSGVPDDFDPTSLQSLMQEFHNALQKIGITASAPTRGSTIMVNGPDDMQVDSAMKTASTTWKLLLVILPAPNTALYNRIKHVGGVKVGIHTICVIGHKFAKRQPRYFTNVALKFNMKLGEISQLVDSARLGIINEDRTIVVGIDTTDPSPGSASNAPGVGMVANLALTGGLGNGRLIFGFSSLVRSGSLSLIRCSSRVFCSGRSRGSTNRSQKIFSYIAVVFPSPSTRLSWRSNSLISAKHALRYIQLLTRRKGSHTSLSSYLANVITPASTLRTKAMPIGHPTLKLGLWSIVGLPKRGVGISSCKPTLQFKERLGQHITTWCSTRYLGHAKFQHHSKMSSMYSKT